MSDKERISELAKRLASAGYYAEGGKIHINPENRGKFNETKRRTGKTTEELTHSSNPLTRKRAVFAQNAAKWKHENGGLLHTYEDGTPGEVLFVSNAFSLAPYMQNAVNTVRTAITGEKRYADSVPSVLPGRAKSDDAISLQNVLLDNGYDVGSKGSDGYFQKNSIKALQQMLVDSGYDLGTNGEAKNGVDGIIGSKTRSAYEDWIDKGAWIKKTPGAGVRKPVMEQDSVAEQSQQDSVVYNPVKNEKEPKMYTGMYNYGEYYDDKFQDYVTDTGLDLSNISTADVSNNNKIDSFNPFVFKNLSECRSESARNTLECASHITYLNLDDKRGFNIDANGIRGNAWTMGDNMVAAGGQRLFDLFAGEGAPSGKWTEGHKQKTIDYVRNFAKDPEYAQFLQQSLRPGDVVELLYPASNSFKKAYTETGGKHQNTHIGYVVQIGDELYIRDNVGNHHTNQSNVHTRKLSSVLSGKERDGVLITGAVRAKDALNDRYIVGGKQGRDLSAFGITPTGKDDASQARLSNDAAYRAMGALYKNKEKARVDNGLSVDEFNRLAGLVQAVLFKETANGELFHNQKWISKNSRLPEVANEANKSERDKWNTLGYSVATPLAYLASDLTEGRISGLNSHFEPSAGLGSVKYIGPASRLTDRQRQQLGDTNMIKKSLRANQPETSGIATFYALSTSMHEVQALLDKYAPKDIAHNPDIVDQLTALAYNQGTDEIEQTFVNAQADGKWDEHMQGLLNASYGKNAMIVRSYNTTNMYTDKERAEAEATDKKRRDALLKRIKEADISPEALAAYREKRESTAVIRKFLPQ